MIHVPTAMRAAFENARYAATSAPTRTHVQSALRRKVGLVTRKTLWSIQRGKR